MNDDWDDAPWPDEIPYVPVGTPKVKAKSRREDSASARVGPLSYDRNDTGNAKRLLADIGPLRWNANLGWLQWNGEVWRRGVDAWVSTEAQRCAAAALAMARALEDSMSQRGFAFYEASGNARAIEDTVKAMRLLPGVGTPLDAFDADPDLITCQNGTVHLPTGEVKPFAESDLITRQAQGKYGAPGIGQQETWAEFLRSCFPDNDGRREYLQRLIGYGITGHTRAQMFVVHVGEGSNGKGTFQRALRRVFKAHTVDADVATFLGAGSTDGARATPNMLALAGARLVVCGEPDQSAKLDEGLIKSLTGEDPITARALYGKPETFMPVCLIQMSTNDIPAIYGRDDGIWRRVHVLRWGQHFTGGAGDLEAELALCSDAILTWAIDGAREWYAGGLQRPPVVDAEIAEHRDESDRLAGFYPGLYGDDPNSFSSVDVVYAKYLAWHEAFYGRHSKPMPRNPWAKEFKRRGAVPVRTKHARGFQLRLNGAFAVTPVTGAVTHLDPLWPADMPLDDGGDRGDSRS